MKWLQSLDLYKVVIFGSLLLLPVAGWWIKKTNDAIATANRAIVEASKPGGQIEEIGKLQKQLEIVEANRVVSSGMTGSVDVYFDGQIFRSAQSGGIDKNQFKINPPRDEVVQTSSKQSARDFIVKVDWLQRGGKDFTFTRDLLFAVLFNCESGARGTTATQAPSIWKLYSLKVANATIQREAAQQLSPPPETEDQWTVGKMEFARREPNKK